MEQQIMTELLTIKAQLAVLMEDNHKRNEKKRNTPKKDKKGNRYWRNEQGELHREGWQSQAIKLGLIGDLPAIVYAPDKYNRRRSRTQLWYQHGRLHRDGGKPAVIRGSGEQEWWMHGKRVGQSVAKAMTDHESIGHRVKQFKRFHN